MIVTGEDVVVVVGVADEVGRTGTTGATVDWVVDVEDGCEDDAVTVEVVEVVAVEVDVDVRGTAEIVLGVVDEMDVDVEEEDVEELVGDSVTVGWTVAITVLPTTPCKPKVSIMGCLGKGIIRLTTNAVANTAWDTAPTP